jgi:uncharacterized protein (TIGR03435 family)
MNKRLFTLAIASSALVSCALAADPTFEVASIKPSGPMNPQAMMSGKMRVGMKIDAARVDIGFFSLADLLRTAYEVKAYQITGPDFIKSERFDISATMPQGATKEQVPAMLRALLEERFALKIHKDSKPVPVYALIVGKGGPKLKDAAPEPVVDPEAPLPAGVTKMSTPDGDVTIKQNSGGMGATVTSAKTGTVKMSMGQDGLMHMESSKMSMTTLSESITQFLDKPVVDMTELKGNYQINLNLSMADMMKAAQATGMMPAGPVPVLPGVSAESASDPAGGSIFASVQALGLKLEPRKEPVTMIVVDHVEKNPSGN